MLHGQHMLDVLRHPTTTGDDVVIVRAHLVSHRYAKQRESPKDLLTYHSAVVLEWSHGQHCTVVELAWLNGLGGYAGRSNWCVDLDNYATTADGTRVRKPTQLCACMPPEMVQPWRNDMAELRVIDHPARNFGEFQAFVAEHTGFPGRFFAPDFHESCNVRLTHRSEADLARYLLNYVNQSAVYHELTRNCQTFAADLFSLLSGRHVKPYHPVIRPLYARRTEWFLYDP